jgi:predicted secreted protein
MATTPFPVKIIDITTKIARLINVRGFFFLCFYFLISPSIADSSTVRINRTAEGYLSVNIKVGDTLIVCTQAVPVTYFRWEVLPFFSKSLGSVDDAKLVDWDEKNLLGREMSTCFKFCALKRGNIKINFVFFAGRSYSKNNVEDAFSLNVKVVPNSRAN